MKRHDLVLFLSLVLVVAGLGTLASGSVLAQGPVSQGNTGTQGAIGTAFTYQGRLTDGGSPASGTYDLRFILYDADSGGSQVGNIVTLNDVTVTDGLFTVQLDFGNVFDGTALWLEIAVRPGNSTAAYTTLSPRQALTAAPYARYAASVPWSGLTGVPAGFADGTDDNTTYSAGTGLTLSSGAFSLATAYRLPQSCTNGQVAKWNGTAWTCGDDNVGTGGGGDITAVNAGNGLTGGGTSGDVTLNVDFAGTGSATTVARSDHTHPGSDITSAVPTATLALSTTQAAWGGLQGVPAGFADNTDDDTLGSLSPCTSGQVAKWNGTAWACSADADSGGDITAVYAGSGLVGGGIRGDTTLSLDTSYTDGRYWKWGGNSGTDPSIDFLGTTDNVTLTLAVSSTAALRLAPNTTSPNLIGGYDGNSVTSGVVGAMIGGGGVSGAANTVTDNYGTVGGGASNQAGDNTGTTSDASYATVGGGWNNTASDQYAFVGGGWSNQATITGTVVGGGRSNTASGKYATVGGGWGNTASGLKATVAGGYINDAAGPNAFVGGGYNNNIDATASYGTISGGVGNKVNTAATYATIGGGNGNTASGNNAATVSGGKSNTASGSYATVSGGQSNTASGSYATVAGGYSNTASGTSAFVGGGGYNGISASGNQAQATASTISGGYGNVITPTASYATVGGGNGNTASGLYAFVGGGYLNTAGSSSYATVAGGKNNTATGSDAAVGGGRNNNATASEATVGGGLSNSAGNTGATVGGGNGNSASGIYATVGGGNSNSASGSYATVGGGNSNTASGLYATVPGGRDAQASHYGEIAHASGSFTAAGDAQSSQYVMRGTTSDGGKWHNLYLDGLSQQLTLASGRTMTFDILIVGRSTSGKSAGYHIQGVIENVGGTTAFVGSPTVSTVGEDDTAWDAQVLADNSADALLVQVQGNTGDTIGWVAVVRTAEVVY